MVFCGGTSRWATASLASRARLVRATGTGRTRPCRSAGVRSVPSCCCLRGGAAARPPRQIQIQNDQITKDQMSKLRAGTNSTDEVAVRLEVRVGEPIVEGHAPRVRWAAL